MRTAAETLNIITYPETINQDIANKSEEMKNFSMGMTLGKLQGIKFAGIITREEYNRARSIIYFLYYGMEITLIH